MWLYRAILSNRPLVCATEARVVRRRVEADRPEAESKQKSMMSPMTIRLIVLLIVGVLASALPGVSGAPGAAGQFEGMSVLIDASKGAASGGRRRRPRGSIPRGPTKGAS